MWLALIRSWFTWESGAVHDYTHRGRDFLHLHGDRVLGFGSDIQNGDIVLSPHGGRVCRFLISGLTKGSHGPHGWTAHIRCVGYARRGCGPA